MASVEILLVLAGAVPAVFGAYLAVLTVAAFFHRRPRVEGAAPSTRVTVLVPAHNESVLVTGTIRSLLDQRYPRELFEVVVIADNCTDDTAALASAAGARVLERDDPDLRGKGHALRWAMDLLVRTTDAIVVVDADTQADPAFLATMVAELESGSPVVQGESLLRVDGTPRTALRVAAFLLINRVRPTGRRVLGLPCTLCGNGMMFARDVLLAHPWEAFTAAEDLEFAIALRSAGIRPAFARGAVLLSSAAPDAAAADQQQLRWEGGKTHLARCWVPRLIARGVRERRPALLDIAFDLALPPLGLLAAAGLAGLFASGLLVLLGAAAWTLTPWLVTLGGIAFYVLAGLKAADAPAGSYGAMAQAPLLIARKLARVHHLLGFRADSWVRTARTSGETESR